MKFTKFNLTVLIVLVTFALIKNLLYVLRKRIHLSFPDDQLILCGNIAVKKIIKRQETILSKFC